MWDYLEDQGVLNGTDAEIKAAKKAYRKDYLTKYKRGQRSRRPEFIVNFSQEKGEYGRIQYGAKTHKMPITGFIRQAALSYLNRTYIVPNKDQIARLEQVLSDCLNEIQNIVSKKERYFFDRDDKYAAIEKRIVKLEAQLGEIFRNPPLSSHDH